MLLVKWNVVSPYLSEQSDGSRKENLMGCG